MYNLTASNSSASYEADGLASAAASDLRARVEGARWYLPVATGDASRRPLHFTIFRVALSQMLDEWRGIVATRGCNGLPDFIITQADRGNTCWFGQMNLVGKCFSIKEP